MSEVLLKYPAVFLVGALVALLLTRVWGPRAPRWGFLDRPGGRKQHGAPTPTAGGLAVFIGFHAACAVVFLWPWAPFAGQAPISWWWRFLPLSAGAAALGLLDDRYTLRPSIKLAGQLLLAIAAYGAGLRLQNVLGTTLPVYVDFAATVVWYVALMNAFNLIDGMDGLAAGIAVIASIGIAISLVFRQAPGDVLLFLGFAGACAGFLRYNFYPARVFLGDTGSLFIGFTFASLAISTNSKGPLLAAIGVPLLAAGVPLFDAVLAVWRRSVRRWQGGDAAAAIGRADSDHLHHRLLRSRGGRRQREVALLLYAGTAALSLLGLLISVFNDRALGLLALAFLLGAYTVVRHLAWIELRDTGEAVLEGMTRPVRRNRALLFYVVADIAILNGALLLTSALMGNPAVPGPMEAKRLWLLFTPTDVGLPFIALILFRSYTRVWYLARISEYAATGIAVATGVAAAFAVQLIGWGAQASLTGLAARYLFFLGLAAPAIVGVRAALRVVQDLHHGLSRGLRRGGARGPRALICGAGYRTTLFFRLAGLSSEREAPLDIVGLVAEDEALRDHFVHGLRVLDHVQNLAHVIREHRIEVVFVVEDLAPENEQRAIAAAAETNVRLVRWRIVEEEVRRADPAVSAAAPGADAAASRAPARGAEG